MKNSIIDSITLEYKTKYSSYKQNFDSIEEAANELNRFKPENRARIKIELNSSLNWYYELYLNIENQVWCNYIAYPGNTCKSGGFGDLNHFLAVTKKDQKYRNNEILNN